MIGSSVLRKEDSRLLTGKGQYSEDPKIPGLLHLVFIRSPHAHARIARIDASQAVQMEGVVAFLSHENCPPLCGLLPDLLEPGTLHNPYCDLNWVPQHAYFPSTVRYVGEAFGAVIATSPYIATDAAAVIDVEYEVLPATTAWRDGMLDEANRVHPEHPNLVAHLAHQYGDFDHAVREADFVITDEHEMQSVKSMALECRVSTAQWDSTLEALNVWSTTQVPYVVRESVAAATGLNADKIRLIARDIGGGFGLKGVLSPEDVIVPITAHFIRRSVRWVETRSEHMLASHHSGVQVHKVTIAAKNDGRILGLDIAIYKELGAYNHFEMVTPTNTVNHLLTHYHVPNFRAEAFSVLTNKTPVTPYRGAGRIEAVFTMDRVLDAVAKRAKLDPLQVRRVNIVRKDMLPYRSGLIYRDGKPTEYENMDFEVMLESAVEMIDYEAWRRDQPRLRREGRRVGLGVSSYVEAGGIGPCEGANVRIENNGRVTVSVGVNSQGQSHETTFAQICSHALGIDFDLVDVRGGDTSVFPIGFGTAASRVLVNTGNAIALATAALKEKTRKFAALLYDCSEQDVALVDGMLRCPGDRSISLAELASAAQRNAAMNGLGGPGLAATEFFYPRTVTWSSGVHAAVVEVDPVTGQVDILDYAVVHDCGIPINPMVVEGQISGGLAQGLGIALLEELQYDSDGQVVSGSLMDYAVPRARIIPSVKMKHFVFPTGENPLGIRAIGESGPLSVPAVLAAAIEDAIGCRRSISRTPITPQTIRELLHESKAVEGGLQ